MADELEQRSPTTTESTYPFFRSLFGIPFGWPEWAQRMMRAEPFENLAEVFEGQAVRVEEYVEGDQLVIRAELPGIDPDKDVEITVADRTLRIRAERRQEEEVKKRDFRRREIRYGAFTRRIPLPAEAKPEDVQASYSDGILTVRVPIDVERAGVKKIPISRG